MAFKKKGSFPGKKNRHVLFFLSILWIMVNIFSVSSYAKTNLKKRRPVGVMATAVGTQVAVSWEPVTEASGYQIFEAVDQGEYAKRKDTSSTQAVLNGREPGKEYRYYVRAYRENGAGLRVYGKPSEVVSTTVPVYGKSTVKNFLRTAIAPVGSTMYVWGGGWNKADTGSGPDAKRIGLSPAWRKFSENKKSSYRYQNYRYQIHNGLDCSGYVGWTVYNVMNTKKNKKGYVCSASKQAKRFADYGFGSYIPSAKIEDYRAGDIMSSVCACCGHVWIVVGQCEDGSVVLVHASPSGVQLAGTVTPKGKKKSQAFLLAKKYMKKYYPDWYKRYPGAVKGKAYLTHYGQMRWYTDGGRAVLSDPDGYQEMSAEGILHDLFDSRK